MGVCRTPRVSAPAERHSGDARAPAGSLDQGAECRRGPRQAFARDHVLRRKPQAKLGIWARLAYALVWKRCRSREVHRPRLPA
jgi:hypothetical protein